MSEAQEVLDLKSGGELAFTGSRAEPINSRVLNLRDLEDVGIDDQLSDIGPFKAQGDAMLRVKRRQLRESVCVRMSRNS